MIKKNLSVLCWYGLLNYRFNFIKFESVFISLKNFWIPSNSWSTHFNKYKTNKLIPSLKKTINALKYLFSFFFVVPSFFIFSILPKKHSHTTVTRGPMVRKKQSREEVSTIYSYNKLDLSLYNFFNLFICKSLNTSLFFFLFLIKVVNSFIKLLDFLLLQQFSISIKLNLSVFLVLS